MRIEAKQLFYHLRLPNDFSQESDNGVNNLQRHCIAYLSFALFDNKALPPQLLALMFPYEVFASAANQKLLPSLHRAQNDNPPLD